MAKEVAEEYLSSLLDLTFNSKPLINMLTMLAEENAEYAPAIVQAIESHIEKVAPDVKLPVLYLIDSIVKNVGPIYVPLFTNNIVRIFASVFEKVDEKTRTSMFKVRGTWADIFPPNKLYMLDLRIQHVDPHWPILAPPPSIHVNPKFLTQQQNTGTVAPVVSQTIPPNDSEDLEATYRKKKQILLDLQEKKKQLEMLQKDTGKVGKGRGTDNFAARNTPPPTAAQGSAGKTKISPPNSILIEAAKSRDPRLARARKGKAIEEEASKQESDEEEQRTNLKLDMLRRSEAAKAQASVKTPDPRVDKKIFDVKPEIKKTENEIHLRQTAMLKAPVLAQLNPTENKSENNKNKRRRSPESRGRRDKIDRDKNDEKSSKEVSKPTKRSKESKYDKSPSKGGYEKAKRDKGRKVRIERKEVTPEFSLPPSQTKTIETDENEEYNPATFVPESKPVEPIKPQGKIKSKPVEVNTPEPPPPPVIRQDSPKVTESELEDEDIIREEVLKTKPKEKEPVGFKHLKKPAKGRNYSRRNKERSRSPTPPQPTDTDLRIGVSDISSTTEDSPPRCERSDDAENKVDVAKDIDFRMFNVGSPSKKRLSTDASYDEPPAKKGKSAVPASIQLFGMKDMDERMIPANRLPSPPPPPVISSAPGSPKNRQTPPPLEDDGAVNMSHSSSSWSDAKSMPDPDSKHLLLPPQMEINNLEANEREVKSPANVERDRLGRPLLYDKLPSDPRARRESLGSQASREDTDLRRGEDFQVENLDGILAQAREQVNSGKMTHAQFNELVSQILHLSEEQKIRDAKRMGQRAMKPFGNLSPQYEGTNRQRFGDMDYRPGGRSRPYRGPFEGRWRNGAGRRGGGGQMHYPPENRRFENRFGGPERSPEHYDQDSKSQDAWPPEMEHDMPSIPPTDAEQLAAIAADPVKFIAIDGTPRPIRYYGSVAVYLVSYSQAREIKFEDGVRCVMIAGLEIPCQLNGPPVNFIFKNNTHSLRLGAPTRELYIDNRFHEAHFGGPPIQTELAGFTCTAQLQGPPPQVKFAPRSSSYCLGIVHLIIDAHAYVQIFLDAKPQRFEVDGHPFVIKLANALRTVLINNIEVNLKFGGVAVPIWVAGAQHFLRLSELPRGIIPGRVSIQDMEAIGESGMSPHDSNSQEAKLEEPSITSSDVNREMYFDMMNSVMGAVPDESKAIGFNYKVDPSVPPPVRVPAPALPAPVFNSVPPPVSVAGPTVPNLNVSDLIQSLLTTGLIGNKPEPKPTQSITDHRVKPVRFDDVNSMREKQPGLVAYLYSGIQCGSCGVRFSTEDTIRYSQHLDWHFRQNRRDRDAAKRGASRRWYYDMSDWIQFEEIEDIEERAQNWFDREAQGQNEVVMEEESSKSVAAPSGGEAVVCYICHDRFDTFFHQETEEWHLRSCVSFDEKYYHPTCYQDSLKEPEGPLIIETMETMELASSNVLPLLESAKQEPKVEVEKSIIIVEDIDDDEPNEGEIEVVTADEDAVLQVVQGMIDYVIAVEDCDRRGTIEDDELEVLAVTNKDENKPPVELIEVPETGDDDVYYPPSPEVFDPEKPIKMEPVEEMESAVAQVDKTITDVVTSIDGNVVMAEAPQAAVQTQSKIKITFSKPTQPLPEPPKENPCEQPDDPSDLQIEEVEPEPLPLKPRKPRLVGRDLTVYPPSMRGTEMSGLCSIM